MSRASGCGLYGSVKLSAWILPFEVESAIWVAAYLLSCEAVYRAPFDNLYWFMLLSGFREVT